MKRRRGQQGSIVIQSGWYRVRWRIDVAEQNERVQMSAKLAPVVLDREGNPKPASPEIRRVAREVVERSGANSEEHFNQVVLGALTFKERAEAWLKQVRTRRFNPYKETTVETPSYALNKYVYPVIGNLPLSQVNNRTCKPLVDAMFDGGVSVTTANNYMKIVRQIVRSLRDEETGVPIHELKWNRETLGLPKIDREEQDVPAFDMEQVNMLVSTTTGHEQMLYVILAATGLRIGEALGLEVRHILNDGRTLWIEQQVNRKGKIATLKTKAAKRNVDVTPEIAALLLEFIRGKSGLLFCTKNGKPHLAGNLRRRWLDERIKGYGFHSFRRFRVTHLDAVRAHGHLTKVWTGHALSNVTEQYAESLKRNIKLRMEESQRCGTGFAVPAPKCSKTSIAVQVEVAA